MPRLKLEPPVYVYTSRSGRVAHVVQSCAGPQAALELRRADVRRRLCRRCRRG